MVSIRWKLEEVEVVAYKLEDGDVGGSAPPAPIANFDSANSRYAQVGDIYYSDHVRTDGFHRLTGTSSTVYSVPILFDIQAQAAGTITFTATGTAVAGVNYNLTTPSPLTVNAGAPSAAIIVELLDPGEWFDERSLILTLTAGSGVTLGTKLEYRLWIYSNLQASNVEWNATGQTAGAGVYPIQANLSAAQKDQANLHYRVTTTGGLIETTDYTVSASGTRYIAAGDTNSEGGSSDSPDITLTAAGALKSGATIALELDHEPADGSRRNWWTHTHSWKHELYDVDFAGEPTTHGSAGGLWPDTDGDDNGDRPYPNATGTTVIGQDETLHPQTGIPFWSIPSGVRKAKPDGTVMQAVLMHASAETNFYIRESFEGERVCGLKGASAPIGEYNLISVYVDTIPAPEDGRNSQFVRLTQRNRPKDTENSVTFWRASDGSDAAGNPSRLYSGGSSVATVVTDTGTWGLWDHKNAHPLDKWGVEEETVDGVNYTRLWYRHYVPAAGYYCAQQKQRKFFFDTTKNPPGWTGESSATEADAGGVTLTDSAAQFVTGQDPVQVDDVVRNEADFSIATVVSVDSDTQLTLSGLAGGYDDGFAIGDEYTIHNHVNGSTGLDTQQVQGDLQNVLLRFTMYSANDNYGTRTQDSRFFQENGNGQGRGLLAWGPLYVQSSSELLVGNIPTPYAPTGALTAVGRFWEKAGNWPRPRGLAHMDTASSNLTYTFTVA